MYCARKSSCLGPLTGRPGGRGYNTYCIKDELTISMAFPGPVRAGVMIPCRVLYSTYVVGGLWDPRSIIRPFGGG